MMNDEISYIVYSLFVPERLRGMGEMLWEDIVLFAWTAQSDLDYTTTVSGSSLMSIAIPDDNN